MFGYKAVHGFVFSKESTFLDQIQLTVHLYFVSGLVTFKTFGFTRRVNTYQLIREHSVRDSGTKYSLWTPDSWYATKLEHFCF